MNKVCSSLLFYWPDNKLERCLLYRNEVLRQYTRAAGSCSYAGLFSIQMDGDCAASFQLVDMRGCIDIAIRERNDTELPWMGGRYVQAVTGFVGDCCPAHIRAVTCRLRFDVIMEQTFRVCPVDGDTAALDTVCVGFSGTPQVGNLCIFGRYFKGQSDTCQRFDDGGVRGKGSCYLYCAVRVDTIVLCRCSYCFGLVIQ